MPEQLHGLRELEAKLEKLGQKVGAKALRSAALKATTPVIRIMRNRIPKGSTWHRTYKKRIVGPGFASRSIRRISKFDKRTGTASVSIGVRAEAFYAIQFIDQGPYTVTRRKHKIHGFTLLNHPYDIKHVPWFEDTFVASRHLMESKFKDELQKNIEKAIRNGN